MKKLTLITAIFVMVTLLSMSLTALAAGSQSITRTFVPTANVAVAGEGNGDGFETTPANAYDNDTDYAVDTDSGLDDNTVATGTGTDKHNYYNYGMDTIPSTATISGITVRADMVVDATAHTPYTAIRLSWDGGASWTTAKSQTLTVITETTYTYGGTTDDWGHTPWVTSELSDANFRVQVINGDTHTTQNQRDFSLEYIAASITFTPVWDSYSDTARLTQTDIFSGSTDVVYMKGTGFLNGAQTYNVSYYDGGGTKIATDAGIVLVNTNGRGELGDTSDPYAPTYAFTSNQGAQAGTWNIVVQPSGATSFPSNYSTLSAAPDTYELIADDTCTVEASAIPEFPTVMAAIGVAGLCCGIYFWMRRRYRRVEVRIQ